MNNPIEIYNASDEVEASLIAAMLAENGIKAQVVGGILHSAVGGLPVGAVTPRVWANDSDAIAARELIAEYQTEKNRSGLDAVQPGWTCPKCGTEVELGYEVCWKCLYNPSAC
jgi:hypothetical protein